MTYLTIVETNNMKIVVLRSLIITFPGSWLDNFLRSIRHPGTLHLVHGLCLGLSRNPSPSSSLGTSSPESWTFKSIEVSLLIWGHRWGLIWVEPIWRRRRLVVERLWRWRRRELLELVLAAPTPSLPNILLSRPWSSSPSPSNHRFLHHLEKALPLLVSPEQLHEIELGWSLAPGISLSDREAVSGGEGFGSP